MELPEEEYFTIEDIYMLPDGIRAELIDGQIYYMVSSGKTHEKILSYLHESIFITYRIIIVFGRFIRLHLRYFLIKMIEIKRA